MPGVSTKANRNAGPGHSYPNAEETEPECDPDVKKEFDESTGKKHNYNGYLNYDEAATRCFSYSRIAG